MRDGPLPFEVADEIDNGKKSGGEKAGDSYLIDKRCVDVAAGYFINRILDKGIR